MTRRFAFEEGGSSKFWEVSVDGSDMTVHYGRIGTSGQSKTKGFASGDSAQKEADKLISEKTKKGYREVKPPAAKPATATAAVVTPTAAVVTPTAAVVTPTAASTSSAHRVVPTAMVLGELVAFDPPAWVLNKAEASTRTPMRPRKALSFVETWKPLLEQYKKIFVWPVGDAFMERVRARLDSGHEGVGFDIDVEAFTLVLTRTHGDPSAPGDQSARALADWSRRSDPATALRTFLRAESMTKTKSDTLGLRILDEAEMAKRSVLWDVVVEPLRDHLRIFGRDALEAPLREALNPTTPMNRAALAFLLEDEEEARLVMKEERSWLKVTGNLDGMIGVVPDPSDVAMMMGQWYRRYPHTKLVRAVLRHGPSLAEAVLTRPDPSRISLLACYPSRLAARALVALLDSKSARKEVGQALAHMPAHALVALNEAKSKKTKYRDAIDALIATLSASQATASSDSSGLHIDAAMSDVPKVFQAPPWRAKKRASKEAGFEGLLPRRIDPVVDFSSIDPKALAVDVQRMRQDGWRQCSEQAIAQAMATEWGQCWMHGTYTQYGIGALPALLALLPSIRQELGSELGYAGSVEVGPLAIQWLAGKATRKAAEQWVRRFPRYAAAALVPIALSSGTGKAATERDRARALLMLIGKSHREMILEEARHHSADVVRATLALLDADPLEFAPSKPPKVMDGLESLPRIALRDGRLLPVECNAILLEMLAFTAMDPPYAGIEQTKAACDPRSLDVFVEALVRTWVAAGMPTAHEWAVRAVAVIGTDKAARFLFDRARAWAQDNQKQRALLAIDVLGAMGTDLSLSLVGRMSRSSLRQYMKDRATELLAEIASYRGLSSDELEDRTAPDLGLDAHGTLVLDFGPRAFRVGFDEHLAPFVQTSEGERLDAFPRPNKNDDAAKAKAASEAWKLLKSEAEKVSRDQVARLERMMADERRVDAEVFVDSFVHHPLIGHLTKRLIWGAFDARGGALLRTFRVSEDKTLASVEDDMYALPSDALIGLIHPYSLRAHDGLTARWRQVLSDYAVMQPFGQLARPTETFAPEAVSARYANKKARASSLYTLRAHGWRADVRDYGDIEGFTKDVGDYRYRLSLSEPMVHGEASELHEVSMSIWHEGDATKPSAVQLAELVYQLDRVIVA